MSKKLTTEEFKLKALVIHKDKYDYSNVNYVNSKTVVSIICKEHGEFMLTPNVHLKGCGCPHCGGIKAGDKTRKTQKLFIEECKVLFPDYDYSKTVYTSATKKVIIICPKHGDFNKDPNNFLALHLGCPQCELEERSKRYALGKEAFIERSKEFFPNYDYSKINYVNQYTKVSITCDLGHTYTTVPKNLMTNHGCPICAKYKSKGEKFIEEWLTLHNIKFEREYRIKCPVNVSNIARIDFYLPDYNLFIEFNGKLHYTPVELFGGTIQFLHQINRDEYVRNYCKSNGIELLEIPYDADINEMLNGRIK